MSRKSRLAVRRYTRDRESRRTVTRQSPYCKVIITFSRRFSQHGNIAKYVAEQYPQKLLLATEGADTLPQGRYKI